MKNYINLCFCLFVFAGFGQKTLQSYTLELGETKIIIHAKAESVDRLHFTLKNELGNVYTPKSDYRENYGIILNDENHIAFKVFPFTETELAAKLSKAIELVNTIEKESNNSKKNLTVDKENYRNIFQFFNALVITAFQYDTEPIAGVLKYQLKDIVISKNTLQGQVSTKDYFDRQAKLLRNRIYENKAIDVNNDFLIWVVGTKRNGTEENTNEIKQNETGAVKPSGEIEEKSSKVQAVAEKTLGPGEVLNRKSEEKQTVNDPKNYLKEFENYKDLLKRDVGSGRNKFKKYAAKRLAEIYNEWKFSDDNEDLKQLLVSYKKFLEAIDLLAKEKLKQENLLKIEEGISTDQYDLKSLEKDIQEIETELSQKKGREEEISKTISEIEGVIKSYESQKASTSDSIMIKKIEENFEQSNENLGKRKSEQTTLTSDIATLRDKLKRKEKEKNELESKIVNEQRVQQDEKDNLTTAINDLDTKLNTNQQKINQLIFENKATLTNIPLWNFEVTKLEIDINDGFIEHLTATGHLISPLFTDITANETLLKLYEENTMKEVLNQTKGKPIKFENEFPIGFSSRADYVDMYDYKLFHFEGGDKVYSMQLSDELITYVQRHENDRLNFSPRDQVVRLPQNDKLLDGEVELKKEISKKILSAKVYTDFIGFDEGEENSPLQFEVDKEIPIWTKRFNFGLGRSSNYGFLNYANFNLTWAKVTQEDGKLQVSKDNIFVNNQPEPINYVTYLDVVSHENLSVGVDLNIFSLDFPLTKTRLNINAGIHYGRVKIVDEQVVDDANNDSAPATVVTQDTDTNLIRYYPDFMVWVRPDERFGGYLRFRPFRLVVPNTIEDDLYVLSSEKKFLESKELAKEWMQRYEFSAFFKPSVGSDNKFFFRYRYTNSSSWEYNGYSEVQLGYLIYLKF